MKNKTLHICSLVVLAIFLTAASASAQTLTKYEAEIPFDFQVGKKTYEAGEYVVNLGSRTSPATILTIRNGEGRELQRTVVMRNGHSSKDGKIILRFNRYGDQHVLKELIAGDFSFSAPKPKGDVKVWIEKNSKPKPEIVSLVLK